MDEKWNLDEFESSDLEEKDNVTIARSVVLLLFTIILLIIGVKWLISSGLRLLMP